MEVVEVVALVRNISSHFNESYLATAGNRLLLPTVDTLQPGCWSWGSPLGREYEPELLRKCNGNWRNFRRRLDPMADGDLCYKWLALKPLKWQRSVLEFMPRDLETIKCWSYFQSVVFVHIWCLIVQSSSEQKDPQNTWPMVALCRMIWAQVSLMTSWKKPRQSRMDMWCFWTMPSKRRLGLAWVTWANRQIFGELAWSWSEDSWGFFAGYFESCYMYV